MSATRPGAPLPPTFQALSADDPREVGGYRVFARLGAGGMGRVYLSYTPGGRPVALKVVRPELAEDTEFRDRFAREVASARRIHGLYTAQVVDSGVDAATPWLATAYVPGPSLHQVVRQYGPLPERTVLLLMAGIAEALQAIHGVGVVHRDLKPANVLIAADGPRVIDFGIARAADASPLTGTGLRIGSPAFMAPEQALGRPATPATDVFALGALAVYIAGGTPPFGDGPESTALYRAVHEEPDLTQVPAGLHDLLRHCLAKDPEHRPSPAQLIEAARIHPTVGGQLRFADDWLPRQVNTDLARRADLPTLLDVLRAEPDARTVLLPHQAPAVADAPTVADAPPDRSATLAVGPPPVVSAPPARRSRRTAALIATAALLVGAGGIGGAYFLLNPSGGDGAPADAGLPGYTAVYAGTELTSPDHTYEFDLTTGKVARQETATWFLARSTTEFSVPDDNDAYIAPGGQLTLADCVTGIESHPVTSLPFTSLGSGTAFCVRSQTSHDVAVVRVLSTTTDDDGPVKVAMDYYRHDS